jgi:hypothetical protein
LPRLLFLVAPIYARGFVYHGWFGHFHFVPSDSRASTLVRPARLALL